MVPMLTCGLVRSNFAFATGDLLWSGSERLASSAPGDLCWMARIPGALPPLLRRNAPRGSGVKPTACERGALLALGLRDDLLGDVPRNLGVGVELHRVACATRRLAAEVADVAEHLRQGHQALD